MGDPPDGTHKMGPHPWEYTKWGSLLWEQKNRFSSMGTKKWVLFYRNIKNGFSSRGTQKMGSLL